MTQPSVICMMVTKRLIQSPPYLHQACFIQPIAATEAVLACCCAVTAACFVFLAAKLYLVMAVAGQHKAVVPQRLLVGFLGTI